MSVKRYEPVWYLAEKKAGDFVYSSDYDELEARYNALVGAVAWERECDECGEWLNIA